MKGYALFAAALVAVAFGFTACGDDDPPSGPGLDYTEQRITGYRMQYSMKLADPNVRDIADVLVTYIDADGKQVEDTMDGRTWNKTVVMPNGSAQNCGLAARFSAKDNPVFAHDEYDFSVDLESVFSRMYANGKVLTLAWPTNEKWKGILRPDNDGNFRTLRSADYLQTSYGREDIDSTLTYFNFTYKLLDVGRDTIIFNDFDFRQ